MDYITDKVAQKVTENLSRQSNEGQQNGFTSVSQAAETMASSGGKKRKTRRFKITNKNKHKKTIKKQNAGGDWLNSKDSKLIENDTCPICLEKFADTPDKAIYKTDCGHIFHNDCILEICEQKNGDAKCPICRKPLENDCNDVYAFKEKVLGRMEKPDEPYFEDSEIQNIYEKQV